MELDKTQDDTGSEMDQQSKHASAGEFTQQLRDMLRDASSIAHSAVAEVAGKRSSARHLGAHSEADFTMTHRFSSDIPGYEGWSWRCVLAAAPGTDTVTVCEVALLPEENALLAPAWVPWDERIQPGDLAPGTHIPVADDDKRLMTAVDDEQREQSDDKLEPSLGRERVLSPYGRELAVQRWRKGEHGPRTEMARAASGECRGCGFYIPLTGAAGELFGACANELSADGKIVHAEYSCGSHSSESLDVELKSEPVATSYDDEAYDIVRTSTTSGGEQQTSAAPEIIVG